MLKKQIYSTIDHFFSQLMLKSTAFLCLWPIRQDKVLEKKKKTLVYITDTVGQLESKQTKSQNQERSLSTALGGQQENKVLNSGLLKQSK